MGKAPMALAASTRMTGEPPTRRLAVAGAAVPDHGGHREHGRFRTDETVSRALTQRDFVVRRPVRIIVASPS